MPARDRPALLPRRARRARRSSCARQSRRQRCACLGAQPECVADRVSELGAIERVEVEFAHAVSLQLLHLVDRNAGGDHAARLRIIVKSIEALAQPRGYAGSAALSEPRYLGEARDGEDPGNDSGCDARGCAAVTEAQERGGVVEKLRDGAAGAGVDLALEILQIRL